MKRKLLFASIIGVAFLYCLSPNSFSSVALAFDNTLETGIGVSTCHSTVSCEAGKTTQIQPNGQVWCCGKTQAGSRGHKLG